MQAYSQYFANDKDAREYQVKHVLYSLLLFGCLAAYAQGLLSTVWMVLPLMMLVRAGIFFGLLWIIPAAFMAWWLTLRLAYVVSDFVFFHIVHYHNGALGTYRRLLPRWLAAIAKLMYGSDVVDATMYHDIHHRYNMIAPKYMPQVAREMAASEV